jgi:hypothetical protein
VRATFLTARPKALAVRTAALIALATSVICAGIAGGGAATAAAATAKLTITPTGYYNQCRVTVGGTVAGLYANGFDTSIRLWGSDEWDDDLLAGPFVNYWGPYDSGFGREFTLSCSTLNEDWGARDEIYAGVRVYDRRTGRQTESAVTNRVDGYWS